MPELPDITVYIEAIEKRVLGRRVERVRLGSPFLLRTVEPAIGAIEGRRVERVLRVGKRIAIGVEGELFLVLHLMIAGRLHWKLKRPEKLDGKRNLASFDFENGSLVLTEAGSQKRASLHVVDAAGLDALNPGGIEVMSCSLESFAEALTRENHTVKRTLTNPRIFSGIGNAYSDEILHRACLSPALLTWKMSAEQITGLFRAVHESLAEWTDRLRADAGDEFPEGVTAFREDMAVHGRFGLPCPRCGSKVQRIRYASNETNYCARCQTGGRLLADRAMSRLLGKDWPRMLEE